MSAYGQAGVDLHSRFARKVEPRLTSVTANRPGREGFGRHPSRPFPHTYPQAWRVDEALIHVPIPARFRRNACAGTLGPRQALHPAARELRATGRDHRRAEDRDMREGDAGIDEGGNGAVETGPWRRARRIRPGTNEPAASINPVLADCATRRKDRRSGRIRGGRRGHEPAAAAARRMSRSTSGVSLPSAARPEAA